jgi:hypothetical protein
MPRVADYITNLYNIPVHTPHFGVELEVENVINNIPVNGTQWNVVTDGSLRNAGYEILSRRPMTRDVLHPHIDLFYQWLERWRWTTGVRTSTHVHVNVLGKTLEEVWAATVLYTLMEPLLFRYCGPVREENIYCVPWYRSTDELGRVADTRESDNLAYLHNACKYSALYLEPIVRYGTLEFRQAPVFPTAQHLKDWCEMVERIVYSGFESPEQVIETFQELHVDEFVQGVFGDRLAEVLRNHCEVNFEELIDRYDVETAAEIPSASTYQPRAWFTLDYGVEGEGARGYHAERPEENRIPMYEPRWRELDEEPNEDYYEEEEW